MDNQTKPIDGIWLPTSFMLWSHEMSTLLNGRLFTSTSLARSFIEFINSGICNQTTSKVKVL